MNPTFKVITGAMRPYTKDIDGVSRRFLACTASSSVTDLHGDEITAEAIQSMAAQARDKQMTIFLNHSYEVPEDLFGTTTDAIARKTSELDKYGQPIWELDLDIQLNETNPRAVQAYEAYEQGVKMGVSIGAMIEDWTAIDQKAGPWGGIRISGVDLLEASIVGIPANQRSWVKNGVMAIKNLLRKEVLDGPLVGTDPEPDKQDDATEDAFQKLNTPLHGEPPAADEDTTTDTDPGDAPEGDSAAEKAASLPDASPEPDATKDVDGDPEATPDAPPSDPAEDAVAPDEKTASAAIGLLLDAYKAEIDSLRAQLSQAQKDRDEAQEAARTAQAIVERIASLPLGRKTAFAKEVQTFRSSLSGIYDEGFLKLLGRDNDE